MENDSFVVIREYDSVTQAEMAKSVLDGMGIYALIRNEYMATIYPIGAMAAQLAVRREDAERASEAIAATLEAAAPQ